MSADLIQTLVLALIAMASVVFAARHVMPGASRRLQSGLARKLGQPQRGRIAHALGRWVQPADASSGSCGSGGGCAGCGGCGSEPANASVESIALKLEPRIRTGR
ncbi:DUF6587 family protein [Dokdonella sp.]|uniref:DUF6587 family protein n=1 Tax=Dokdonella sp. TaxID=2291710 RepID=UPI00378497DE